MSAHTSSDVIICISGGELHLSPGHWDCLIMPISGSWIKYLSEDLIRYTVASSLCPDIKRPEISPLDTSWYEVIWNLIIIPETMEMREADAGGWPDLPAPCPNISPAQSICS